MGGQIDFEVKATAGYHYHVGDYLCGNDEYVSLLEQSNWSHTQTVTVSSTLSNPLEAINLLLTIGWIQQFAIIITIVVGAIVALLIILLTIKRCVEQAGSFSPPLTNTITNSLSDLLKEVKIEATKLGRNCKQACTDADECLNKFPYDEKTMSIMYVGASLKFET